MQRSGEGCDLFGATQPERAAVQVQHRAARGARRIETQQAHAALPCIPSGWIAPPHAGRHCRSDHAAPFGKIHRGVVPHGIEPELVGQHDLFNIFLVDAALLDPLPLRMLALPRLPQVELVQQTQGHNALLRYYETS